MCIYYSKYDHTTLLREINISVNYSNTTATDGNIVKLQ